jgi:flagellar protein FlgJ
MKIIPSLQQNLAQSENTKIGLLDKSKTNNESSLQMVADQFEAIFLENLLKQARESKLSDGLFDTSADDNFVEMFDKELANTSSKLVDIGIAEAIIRQMSSKISGDNS